MRSTRIRAVPRPDEHSRLRLEERRREVVDAVAQGDPNVIVVAYLELARAHIDAHELGAATSALEHGVEILGSPSAPSWRLLLTLAGLYDAGGDRARARSATRTAREQAVVSGSTVGRRRADALLARLSRPRQTARRPPW
jgi:hypothetical protein